MYEGGPIIQQPFLLGGSSGSTFYPLNVSALVRYPVEFHNFPNAMALQAFLTIFFAKLKVIWTSLLLSGAIWKTRFYLWAHFFYLALYFSQNMRRDYKLDQ